MSQSSQSSGDYYVGVDLGKKQDYTAVAMVRKDPDAIRLVALKVFALGTEYTGVIGYLRVISEKLQTVHRFLLTKLVWARVS